MTQGLRRNGMELLSQMSFFIQNIGRCIGFFVDPVFFSARKRGKREEKNYG